MLVAPRGVATCFPAVLLWAFMPAITSGQGHVAWTTKAEMSEPATLVPTGVANGVLYVVGSVVSPSLFAYNPVSDTWTKKTALPTPRDLEAGEVVNGIIYVVGGRGPIDKNGPRAFAI